MKCDKIKLHHTIYDIYFPFPIKPPQNLVFDIFSWQQYQYFIPNICQNQYVNTSNKYNKNVQDPNRQLLEIIQ